MTYVATTKSQLAISSIQLNLESHAVSYHDLLSIHKTLLMVPDLRTFPWHGGSSKKAQRSALYSSVLNSIYESTLLLCYYNIMHIMDDYHLPFQLSKP